MQFPLQQRSGTSAKAENPFHFLTLSALAFVPPSPAEAGAKNIRF